MVNEVVSGPSFKTRFSRACLAIASIIAFATLAIELEDHFGIPWALSYRVLCAGMCLFFVLKVCSEYPGELWPKVSLLLALLFNIGLFFSSLARLPASKGDILFFAGPDAVIVFAARIVTYRAADDHQRAVRQQMILGLVLALAFCAIIISMIFVPPGTKHP